MDFALTAEQCQLRDVCREFFADYDGTAVARDLLDGRLGAVPDLLVPMSDMGFLGLLGDEDFGGEGGTVSDLVVVAEESGRRLAAGPLVAVTAQAVPLLIASARRGSAAAADLLAPVLAGKQTVTVFDAAALRREGDSVSGTAPATPQGRVADVGLVAVDGSLVAINLDVTGTERRTVEALDPTRELAELVFDAAPAIVVDDQTEHVTRGWRRARSLGMMTLAAELSGVMATALETGLAYARDRRAFGRQIGSFQAVKHLLVETYVRGEQLRSLVWLAAARAESGEDFRAHAAGALAYALEAAKRATDALIQVHGGIGVTWEHDAHLFWRRARTDALLFGQPEELRHDIAEELIKAFRSGIEVGA
jgi:alkylation response protein AidB-like acyl-CoA dehydrogenase